MLVRSISMAPSAWGSSAGVGPHKASSSRTCRSITSRSIWLRVKLPGSVGTKRCLPVFGSGWWLSLIDAARDATHAGKDGVRSGRSRSGKAIGSGPVVARLGGGAMASLHRRDDPVPPGCLPVELGRALTGLGAPVVLELLGLDPDLAAVQSAVERESDCLVGG